MNSIIFSLPGNEILTDLLTEKLKAEKGDAIFRRFPDGETYVRALTDVAGREVILICTLQQPDEKVLPLWFFVQNLRELGAKKIILVAPYLAYMRQDKKFHPGEAVTSEYFAEFISSFIDGLVTIDPHLHRKHSLSELYSIPAHVLHAAELISAYIKNKIKDPVLIGPDSESDQWVGEIARQAGAPFIILEKERKGDKNVEVSVPDLEKHKSRKPVLVDDIVSTAHTMIETIGHLKTLKMPAPFCISIHPVFSGSAYEELLAAGAEEIISCNTITHQTNKIDITDLVASAFFTTHSETIITRISDEKKMR
jgi:ribose-phosphate pyrophosphokinase